MTEALHLVLCDPAEVPEQASRAVKAQLFPFCQAAWANGFRRLAVTVQPEEDAKTIQQLRFYWGVVLNEISEQARIGGERYTADAWHELLKRTHLPRKTKKTYVAGKSRPVITTTIGTTKGLGIRKMSEYIEKCLAFGSTDLGVQFSLRDWQGYRP